MKANEISYAGIYKTPQENKRKRGHEHEEVFLLLMAAMMMASVLAGCGGTEEPLLRIPRPREDTQTPLRARPPAPARS